MLDRVVELVVKYFFIIQNTYYDEIGKTRINRVLFTK